MNLDLNNIDIPSMINKTETQTLIYFIIIFIIMNIFGFFIMYIDKAKAKKGAYRISEKFIFITALLFGGVGIYLGMYKFRHKTKHNLFTVGIPIMIVLNIISFIFIVKDFIY